MKNRETDNKKKILLQFGVRIFFMVIISLAVMFALFFIIGTLIFHSSQFPYVINVFEEFDEHIENYPHIESAMNFWKNHPQEILEGVNEIEQNGRGRISFDISQMDDSGFNSLSYDEQKIVASLDYMNLSQIFKNYVMCFGFKELLCIDITEENFGMVYFYEKKDKEDSNPVLGMKGDTLKINKNVVEEIRSGERENYAASKKLEDGSYVYVIYEEVRINNQPKCVNICVFDWTESLEYFELALQYAFRGLLIITGIILAISILYLYTSTLRPLLKIQKNVHVYMNSMNTEKFLTEMGRIRHGNEIGTLSVDLSDMIRKIEEYHAEIIENTKERSKTENELNIAAQMQAAMLPRKLPEAEGCLVAASMDPAAYVAGDFYDVFMTDENHLVLVIADVTGKGLPAALLAVSAQTSIRCNARPGSRPSELLARLNKEILDKNLDKMFVTAWIGILDIRTGILTSSNAGHEYPMLNSSGVFEKYKEKHSLPAGARLNTIYIDQELKLTKGSSIFVYTDGVTEAVNRDGERFGSDRILKALNENADRMPEEILKCIKHSVTDVFAEGTQQFDDITMMCIRCLENEPGGRG